MKKLHEKLFPYLDHKAWAELDLNYMFCERHPHALEQELSPALHPGWCSDMLWRLHNSLNVKYSYGGYLEDRKDVWKGSYLKPGQAIHLGVDYNVPAYLPVVMPCDGILLCAEHIEDQEGGWGGRMVFKMGSLYTTFGHMQDMRVEIGRKYETGQLIGVVASPERNGGWYPHLHVQCSWEYDLGQDGYGEYDIGKPEYSQWLQAKFPNPEKVLV